MTALALALLMLTGDGAVSAECKGVLDRTPECPAVDDVRTSVLDDAKLPLAPGQLSTTSPPSFPVDKMANELAFGGTILALIGGGTLAFSYAQPTPANDDERLLRDITVGAGVGFLIWSGMVATGAIALSAFDASTGEMRWKIMPETD